MADEDSEKTEDATDARREEFRKKGNVAQTRELGSALLLLVAAGCIYVLGRFFFQNIFEMFNYSFGDQMVEHIRQGDFTEALRFCAAKGFILILPVAAVAAALGVITTVAQVGFLQVEDALSMKFEKINPIDGFGRLFSLRALMEGVKSILKMAAIGFILYFLLRGEVQQIPYMLTYSLEQILQYIGAVLVKLLGGVGALMFVLAAADYFYQRWDLEKKMMMTKEEVKQEHKQREGDPMIKSRIRQIQRKMAGKRMMEAVPKADVIITNPTHIAVAIRYTENLPAPQVIAMGADNVAEKIKELAREHKIPIVENKPLARTIFKTLKIGQVIPRELFVAVAEVLSYVYRLRKKAKR